MEKINQTIETVNEQQQTFSNRPETSTPTIPAQAAISSSDIPPEQHAALFAVINKSRMLNGWGMSTPGELDQQIRTWAEQFNRHDIPIRAYAELYNRAFDVRIEKMTKSGDGPAMDATLLISQWIGEHGLKAEMHRREIESGRILTDVAASQCQRCEGMNMERVFDDKGFSLGLKKGCDHRPIVTGEGIAVYLDRLSSRRKLRVVASSAD